MRIENKKSTPSMDGLKLDGGLMADERVTRGRKRGRPVTLTAEQSMARERERWRRKNARKRKKERDAQRLRSTNFGYFVRLWVPNYDWLTKALVAADHLHEDDVDVAPRVDEATEELFEWIPNKDFDYRWLQITDYGFPSMGPSRRIVGKPGTVRIMITADLADRLVAYNCRREFERSRPRPQPDQHLIKQYRRAQAREQKCYATYRRSNLGPERVEARKRLRRASEHSSRLREQMDAVFHNPAAIDEDDLAKFAEGLRDNRDFLHRTAEAILYKWYFAYDYDQKPVLCNCKLALLTCDCLWGPKRDPAPGALAAPPKPKRPRAGKVLVKRELYSGPKPKWWSEAHYSGSKKHDDSIIRSHDKSAGVGMKGFHAGTKDVWRNNNAEFYPEHDSRPSARDWSKTAGQGEAALQKFYDDPEGTPKSWSNPSDVEPATEAGIVPKGRRFIEESVIEPSKKDEEG
jgi:hypothetical protein